MELKYGGPTQQPPVEGSGQGNGRAPQTWVAIHLLVINMMYQAGHGVYLITALTMVAVSFVCFAFVDDTDVIQTGPDIDSPPEIIISEFQAAMDRWSGGLRATGGLLCQGKATGIL